MEAQRIGQIVIKQVPTMQEIKMEELWQNNPVVIIFFRRFGCLFCRQSAKEISLIATALQQNDVRFVGIGLDQYGLQEFCTENYFAGELFLDLTKENYKALKFKQLGYVAFVAVLFQKRSREIYKKARAEGTKTEHSKGGFQNGGALVVSKGGSEVLYSFKQDNPADFVSNSEILEALGISEGADTKETESIP